MFVCAADNMKAEQAVLAADAGAHVYLSKPMCKDLAGADAMLDAAKRTHDYEAASWLHHGEIPGLEKKLEEAQARLDALGGERMLREEVGTEDIARVVSLWSGVPVSRMLQSEGEKLLDMERAMSARVIHQDEATARCGGRALACRIPPAPSGASCSWGRRGWARPRR